jgi:hypothetical protein
MQPLKALGPHGYRVYFYQKQWEIVGGEVKLVVLDFLNNGIMEPLINSTDIVLIPKKSFATTMCGFCPISLCNVLYKFIANVLANRLKLVLPSITSQHQSAFVLGRLITDNILVAYETLHLMDSRIRGKKGFMTIKLYMSKAYDRVDLNFFRGDDAEIGFFGEVD